MAQYSHPSVFIGIHLKFHPRLVEFVDVEPWIEDCLYKVLCFTLNNQMIFTFHFLNFISLLISLFGRSLPKGWLLSLASDVPLGKLPNLSGPQFSHL